MRKHLLSVLTGLFVLVVLAGPAARPAKAIKQFRDAFMAKYVKADSSDAKDKAFADAVGKAKCNLCHKGSSKKDRNAYGEALDKLLDRKSDKDDKDKIATALDKAAEMKCDPKDPNAPTFGQLLSDGKLPCPEEL
jgi:hypothetical protein